MAKAKNPTDSEVQPAFGNGFEMPAEAPPDGGSANVRTSSEAGESSSMDELARMRAENEALKKDKADLEAKLAAVSPTFDTSKRYKVKMKDAPTYVVQCLPGEHVTDAYFRMAGIHSSMHRPQWSEAAPHEECGLYLELPGQPVKFWPHQAPKPTMHIRDVSSAAGVS